MYDTCVVPLLLFFFIAKSVTIPMKVSHMKQCAEDMELKLQGNKQSLVYSGIKNIVKTSSGKEIHPRTFVKPLLNNPQTCLFDMTQTCFLHFLSLSSWCMKEQRKVADAGLARTGRQTFRAYTARNAALPCGSAAGSAGVLT